LRPAGFVEHGVSLRSTIPPSFGKMNAQRRSPPRHLGGVGTRGLGGGDYRIVSLTHKTPQSADLGKIDGEGVRPISLNRTGDTFFNGKRWEGLGMDEERKNLHSLNLGREKVVGEGKPREGCRLSRLKQRVPSSWRCDRGRNASSRLDRETLRKRRGEERSRAVGVERSQKRGKTREACRDCLYSPSC